MPSYSISETAARTRINRRTLQRWIQRGWLEKDENGLVSLEDVLNARRGRGIVGRPLDNDSLRLDPPFCDRSGLKRLHKLLVAIGHHYQARGDFQSFRTTLADSLGTIDLEKMKVTYSRADDDAIFVPPVRSSREL